MSTIGGIYNFDGEPVRNEKLACLATALESHGPDGGSELNIGSLGMVYRAFHTNRESRQETQPLVSAHGHVLCWDGRLDNREDLIRQLREDLPDDTSDVDIVMAACLRWGLDFLPKLIGDFALALWDLRKRMLLLARDPAGPRPLFYHLTNNQLIWASELGALLDVAGTTLEIDQKYIAAYLASVPAITLTPYKDIHAVALGEIVIFRDGQCRAQRFWHLNSTSELNYKTDAEYEEHFRQLFREAVRCRLRADGPVWASLSGGLDSSSIVCMADEILKGGEAQATRLETVSYVYDDARGSDERTFISCVETVRGCIGHHLNDRDYPPLRSLPAEQENTFPDYLDCFVERHRALSDAMRADGARVLITGHGGDQVLSGGELPVPGLADLLATGRLLELHEQLRTWSAALKRPYLKLLKECAAAATKDKTKGNAVHNDLPPWLNKDFMQKTSIEQVAFSDPVGPQLPSARDQSAWFYSIVGAMSWTSYRSRGRIEVSHPYLDRNLVEFLQALPFQQRVRPGESRSLQRRALRQLLPEKIARRKGKRGPDEAFLRAIGREWARLAPLFENPLVSVYGYTEASSLRAALARGRHGCEKHTFALIKIISLEFWLRALEKRRSASVRRPVSAEKVPNMGQPNRSCDGTSNSSLAATAFLSSV